MTLSAPNRFEVYSEFKDGIKINVYSGGNRDEAVRITNFWDERQDTWLYDRKRLSSIDTMELALIEMQTRISQAVDAMPEPNYGLAAMQMGRARAILAGEVEV